MDLAMLRNIPPATRLFLCGSVVLAAGVTTKVISDQSIAFVPSRIAQGELWRLVTGLFFLGSLNGEFLMFWALYLGASQWLEFAYYPTSKAYAWRLGLLSVISLIGCAYFGIRQPSVPVLAAVEYMSTRRHDELNVFMLIFFRLPNGILPLHHVISAIVFGEANAAKGHLLGIALGHALLLLDDVYPKWTQHHVLALPGEARP